MSDGVQWGALHVRVPEHPALKDAAWGVIAEESR